MSADPTQCGKCGQPHARCSAHKRNGQPCGAPPMSGQRVCRMHGGQSPRALAAVARREAEAAVVTFGARRDVDPISALLEEVQWSAGHVAWLRGVVQSLERAEVVWGTAEEAEKHATEFPGVDVTRKAAVNVWVGLYERERRLLADLCAAALKAGVEERQVRLAESQGELFSQGLRWFVSSVIVALGVSLDAGQWQVVRELAGRMFAALAAGEVPAAPAVAGGGL